MKFLNKVLRKFGSSSPSIAILTRSLPLQLAAACQARARHAQDLDGEREITLSQMETVVPMVEYLHAETPPFPIDIPGLVRDLPSLIAARKTNSASRSGADDGETDAVVSPTSIVSAPDEDENDEDEDDDEDGPSVGPIASKSAAGATAGPASTLLPKKHFSSHTGITLRVDLIALKNPEQYIEPFLTIRLCDPQGKSVRMGEPQDTAPGKCQPDCVKFNQDVHLQIAYEQIEQWDLAIFIEFMYYKPKSKKKDKMKCLCWCMIEPDELVANKRLPLEIYGKKPVYNVRHTKNYSKLKLLSSDQQFLYVTVIRHEPDHS